ncbi:MAG: cytochrome c [Bacteroidota bacterium]
MSSTKCITLILLAIILACCTVYDLPPELTVDDWRSKTIPSYPQLLEGQVDSGFYYLVNGAYLGTGLPYDLLQKYIEKDPEAFVERSNLASEYGYAVFESELGVKVMNGTCFSCHAGKVNGEVVLGLGNSLNDNQASLKLPAKLMNWQVRRKYKRDTATIESFDIFGKFFSAMAPYVEMDNPGVNPAARIAEACMRYRDPVDLSYTDEAQYEVREYNVGSDIPALWHLQKKNALYYTAVGRGDFTKLLFQASVLGIQDSTAAREAQEKFVHITAWIRALESPAYPQAIDQQLAQRGEVLFAEHCQSCHGTYGEEESYPNKVIALDAIGTDPLYAQYAADSKITEWYNKSWFATSEPRSWFEAEQGYIAPPLDGIWATAPYFHNGAVPDLYGVLNSKTRPTYWQRSENSKDMNWRKGGWQYTTKKNGGGKRTFDTTLPGYSNQGHTYGDKLSEEERWALIEYLKGL